MRWGGFKMGAETCNEASSILSGSYVETIEDTMWQSPPMFNIEKTTL